jgi:hypothetical protein
MTKLYLVLILLTFNTACLATNNILFDGSAGIVLDDNITQAKNSADVKDDSILNFGLSAGYKIPFNDISKLLIHLSLDTSQYSDISRWSFYDLALKFDYQIQPGTGYTAPWYYISATLGQLAYDSNQRDGSYTRYGLGMVKRLSDTIDVRLGAENQSIDADENIGVFDLDTVRIFLNLDYKFDASHISYITLAHTDGDYVTTVLNTSPIIASLGPALSVVDDIFSNGSWNSYKTDASTLSLLLGHNYAINSLQSIDASILFHKTDAYQNIEYDGIILQLNYLHRF